MTSRLYCKITVINTVWDWQKYTDQWNRIESSEIDLHKCNQLIFDKGAKAINKNRSKIVSSTNDAGTTGHPHVNKK